MHFLNTNAVLSSVTNLSSYIISFYEIFNMSLLRFLSVKPAEKRKLSALGEVENSPTKCKNKAYDKNKRQRRYQRKWSEMWFWLDYNENEDLMFCKVCRQYPSIARSGTKNVLVEGCDNFRIETLRSHDDSAVHKESLSRYRQEKETRALVPLVSITKDPIHQAFRKIDASTRERFRKLFTVAYTIAKNGRPISDMIFHCSMLKKIGVDIGDNYTNPKAARGFVSAISSTIRQTEIKKIQECSYVSVLADGSTDCRVTEQEVVYVRYVADGRPKTVFANVIAVEHAHSQGVYDAVVKGLGALMLNVDDLVSTSVPGPKLVSINFDGAAVMMGKKTGVSTKFTEVAPHAIPMHCVAHKLELSILDAVKKAKYLGKFEDTVKGLFKFYHYSPKMRREISEISRVLDEDLAHFSSIKQVRWLSSKLRAITSIKKNLHSLVLHMESASTGKSDNSAKAKGYLKEITSQPSIRALHVMLDILPILSNISKAFQRQDLLVIDVSTEIEKALMQLNSIKQDPSLGMNISTYIATLNANDKTFGDITIGGKCSDQSLSDMKECPFLVGLVEDITHYVEKRFDNFSQMPLRGFEIFNFNLWPSSRDELCVHGNDELCGLVSHFEGVLSEHQKQNMRNEFCLLKGQLKSVKSTSVFNTYSNLLLTQPASLSNILKLVEIMFAVSPSTAECERSFSAMNRIKTLNRNSLDQISLQDLMNIVIHGPTVEDFCPDAAIDAWLTSGPGTRHVKGHLTPVISDVDWLVNGAVEKD